MRPIAHIRTDLPQKFGIPRNSFLAPHLEGSIVFEPEFALPQAVEGLEEFSHVWLIWGFENGVPGGTAADVASDAVVGVRGSGRGIADRNDSGRGDLSRDDSTETHCGHDGLKRGGDGGSKWSPTVRPPRLGGVERKGVFATRSPFRPNAIGLTCVKLERIDFSDAGPVIHVLGADLRDGTPVYDIKPYIPFADCHPDATGGWIDRVPWRELEVLIADDLLESLEMHLSKTKLAGLIEVLRQDPRRAGSKHEPSRIYHLAYAGLDVAFKVDGDALRVVAVHPGRLGMGEDGEVWDSDRPA